MEKLFFMFFLIMYNVNKFGKRMFLYKNIDRLLNYDNICIYESKKCKDI